MSIPGIALTINDGGLGITSPSIGTATITMGCATKAIPNTLYGGYSGGNLQSLTADLGYGPGVEALALKVAGGGGPHYFMEPTPTYDGAASAVTKIGTGTGTISAVAFGPVETITIYCSTAGNLGTAEFQFKHGSGAYSAPVVSAAGWATGYVIPGSMSSLRFIVGTGWDVTDTFTVSTTGVITQTVNPGPGTGNLTTLAAQPVDDFTVRVEITTAGALATAQFRYTMDYFVDDSGNFIGSWSPTILTVLGGLYAIPNTGIYITLNAATHDLGNTYDFTTIASGTSGANAATAMTTLFGLAIADSIAGGHFANMPISASSAATIAGTNIGGAMTTAETARRFLYWMTDCPTVGSRVLAGGVPTVDAADTDSVDAAAFVSITSKRVCTGAGDALVASPLSARLCRRPASWLAAARAGAVTEERNLHRVRDGALPFVAKIYRDEGMTEALDAARFVTLRTHKGKGGYFITRGRTLADVTSDFSSLAHRRVMDLACRETLAQAADLIGDTVRLNSNGTIQESEALAIENEIGSALETVLVNGSPQKASSVDVTIDRTENIASSETLPMTVAIVPLGSLNTIAITIGYAVTAA